MSKKVLTMDDNGNQSWEDSPLFQKDVGIASGIASLDANGKHAEPSETAIGTITRATSDSTGDIVVTGLGFKPHCFFFIGSDDGTSTTSSNGWSSETANTCTATQAGTMVSDLTKCISISDGTNGWTGTVSAASSDGFTVSATKMGLGKNITIKYLAIL